MSGVINRFGSGRESGIIFEPYYAYGYWGNSASSTSVAVVDDTKFQTTKIEEGGTGSWSDANDRFTCQLSGIYRMTGTMEISATAPAGRWGGQVKIDGTTNPFSNSIHEVEGTGWDTLTINWMGRINAGSYAEFWTESVPSGGNYWQYGNGGWNMEWIGF